MEIIRNFCPHCNTKYKLPPPIFCSKCGSIDLIPFPEGILLDGAVPKSPKIEIDPQILSKLKEPFVFITGPAGSGKTTLIRQKAFDDPSYIELCASTGIASVNLGGRTINSVLKYFNTKSLENIYKDNKLQWYLRKIRNSKKVLGIEEGSMVGESQFTIIMAAIDEINNDRTGKMLGVHFIADFCQLPPINERFAFRSPHWKRFEENTIKLTKIWRQDDLDFITAVNLVRAGRGKEAVNQLNQCNVKMKEEIDWDFDGTTLIALNDKVDYYNNRRLQQINSPVIRTVAKKGGKQLNEWIKLIPDELRLKIGAYVMILSNDVPNFTYCNGDCGIIKDYDSKADKFTIELRRNNQLVKIGRISRENLSDRSPSHDNFTANFSPRVDPKTGDWVLGFISFHPLRLAYASTVHKSQSLSLDSVQIDSRDTFFSYPGLAYVAISRARTANGLQLIGKPNDIANKIILNKEVARYV